MSVDIKMYLKCSFIFKLVCLQSSLCIRTRRCKVSCVHLRMSLSMRNFARHWTMCHVFFGFGSGSHNMQPHHNVGSCKPRAFLQNLCHFSS